MASPVAAPLVALAMLVFARGDGNAAEALPAEDAGTAESVAIDPATLPLSISVTLGHHGTYPFIVDTGSPRSAIADNLVGRLSLEQAGAITLHTMAGVDRADTVLIPELEFNNLKLTRVRATVLQQRYLGTPGAAGLLGLDALKSRRLVADFRRGIMTISPSVRSQRGRDDDWEGESIVVTARQRFGQLVLTNAIIGGRKVEVLLDTGLQVSIGNEALRRQLFDGDEARAGRWETITLESVTGEAVEVEATTVRSLRVADMVIARLPLAFGNVHPFKVLEMNRSPALILGIDVLRHFDQISVDFRTREIGFRWAGPASPPDL